MIERFTKDIETKFKLAQMRVRRMIWKISTNFSRQKNEREFRNAVSEEKIEEQKKQAMAFAGEFLDYLLQDPRGRLAPLYLKENQEEMLRFIADGVSEENEESDPRLVLDKTYYRQSKTEGENIIGLTFTVGSLKRQLHHDSDLASVFAHLTDKAIMHAAFNVSWSVDRKTPMNSHMYGTAKGIERPADLIFLFFSNLDEPQNLSRESIIASLEKHPNEELGITIDSDGTRFFVTHKAEYEGEEIELRNRYHLLGEFEGLETNQRYFVYGTNTDNSVYKSKEKQSNSQVVGTEFVSNTN